LKSCCQSKPWTPIQSKRATFRKHRGRPATGPRRRVDARWRPYAGRGPTCQVATSSRAPQSHHSPSLAPLPSLSPSLTQSGAPRRHCRRRLPRARAPSSSRHAPIPSSSSTTAPSSTLSTPSTGRWSEGKVALADFTTTPCAGPRWSRGRHGQSS
jgi:hypothetical protein